MADPNPTKGYKEEDQHSTGDLQIAAYMFAGLAMMLNIRLSYSAAPYALLRFKLPENLFSVFVRTTSSALELWCIPSMLLGNIMEQFYNHTQNNPSTHATNLKNSSIKTKAENLKGTVDTQSNSELTKTRDADIKGNEKKGGQLDAKATELQRKANLLHDEAGQLAQEAATAESPLAPLSEHAKNLKEATKKEIGDNEGLYYHAGQLVQQDVDLVAKANNVITSFEAVKRYYGELMEATTTPEQKLKVNSVTNAYTQLKTEYDQMLNLTKLAVKANELQQAGGGKLRGPAEQLKNSVETLRNNTVSTNDYTNAKTVIQNYEKVETAYNNLPETEKQPDVKDKFEAVKTLYDPTFKFTKVKYYSEKLSTAANSSSFNAADVIKYYGLVVDSYELLGDSKGSVQSQFDALQTEYSEAIYVYKKCIITWPSISTNWLNFLTFVILLIVFVTGGDKGHVTSYYWIMAASGFVFGINMVLVYAVDYRYLAYYMAGENSFPMVTSLILYFATSIFGNRRKYNSDYLVVVIDVSIAILIAFVASVLWTVAFYKYRTPMYGDLTPNWPPLISPVAMVIVGMGLVYSIYPGIAPGMIVPFYLIDKIEMVLLVATAFPPVIIAILRKTGNPWSPQSPQCEWNADSTPPWMKGVPGGGQGPGWFWHLFDILIPLKISLAIIFIYSLHYRDSSVSRAIVNQPKMSTSLSIMFYMCHEILLAMGFPGVASDDYVLLPMQLIGAYLMVLLAYYSVGYITEYKKHDPSHWPTEGMTKWNALCYWLKMASKITNKNFKQLFTTDLRRDLLLCIQKNELI